MPTARPLTTTAAFWLEAVDVPATVLDVVGARGRTDGDQTMVTFDGLDTPMTAERAADSRHERIPSDRSGPMGSDSQSRNTSMFAPSAFSRLARSS